jgi:outer membrane immunogenic protein
MRMLSKLAATAALTALAAPAAMAADLYTPPPAPPPMYSPAPVAGWGGFYAGVHAGGGWGTQNPDTPAEFDLDGPYAGVQLGYNFVSNQFLFGLEADASWSGINGVRVTSGPGGTTTEDIDWFGTVRGRLGYVMGDWMPYVTGGWAYSSNTRTNNGIFGAQTTDASHSGWTAGLGAEYAFAPGWSVKGEYKYFDFGSATYNWDNGPPSDVSLKMSTFEIGLNRHF